MKFPFVSRKDYEDAQAEARNFANQLFEANKRRNELEDENYRLRQMEVNHRRAEWERSRSS